MLKVLFLAGLFLVSVVYAQETYEVEGTVRSEAGQPIAFAAVSAKGSGISTMANEEGRFILRLPAGLHTLVFRFVGYRGTELEVDPLRAGPLNVVMQTDVFELKEVNITARRQDPAYPMIRQIIARRKHLRSTPSYECEVYTKGVQKLMDAPKRLLGEDVSKTLKLDSNGRGILYQSETRSKLYFEYPHKKEVMQASKVAGDNKGFSFNRALDLQVNFYDNTLHWKALGDQSFVSPVADNAFRYYRFKLVGSSSENGRLIHKIAVIPKRKYSPVFSGHIYVIDGDWRLYSVDLVLTEAARINFVDTLHINQHFSQIEGGHWLPSDITIRFSGKVLGFDFAGYFLGLYSNYKASPQFPDNFFEDEILKITSEVNRFDSQWWAARRPVPLTAEEAANYRSREAAAASKGSEAYRDSLQRELNKFKPLRYVLVGQRIEDVSNNSYWYIYPLHNTVFYNTVEGWGLKLRARYVNQISPKKSIEFEPNFRYGFDSKTTNANAEITYRIDTLRHTSLTLRGGSDFLDLNNKGTINLFYNTLTTLFEGKNYLKLYRAKFLSFSAQREISGGLMLSSGVDYARRIPVQNSSYQSIFDRRSHLITSNNPLSPALEADVFPINNALSIETKLSYTFGQRYTTRPDGKIYEDPRFPTLMLNYRRGIPGLFNSVVNYDFISADLYQDKIRTGLWGYSSFYLSAGKFLNTRSLYYPDMHHFTGNQTAIYNPLFPNFHFLDYYAYSTDDRYFEAHYEHNFSGRFLSRVPLIRKLKLEEIVGGAYLTQPKMNYKEVYFGIRRLVFRADYGFAWSSDRKMYQSVRLFYGF